MKRILLDVDGVLADLTGATVPFLAAFGIKAPVTAYDFGLSPEGKEYLHDLWSQPGFHSLINPTSQAEAIIKVAMSMGDVRIVTASFVKSRTWEHERRAWLRKHFGIPANHVSFVPSGEKHHVRGDKFIDDHYPNAHAWAQANPGGESICMVQPWSEVPSVVDAPQNLWIIEPDQVARAMGYIHDHVRPERSLSYDHQVSA